MRSIFVKACIKAFVFTGLAWVAMVAVELNGFPIAP